MFTNLTILFTVVGTESETGTRSRFADRVIVDYAHISLLFSRDEHNSRACLGEESVQTWES